MTIAHEIFKAYDIRGVVDKSLTEEIAVKIGHAVGSEVQAQGGDTIIIGRDGRLSGPKMAENLSKGLRASGVDVVDIGVAPSPVVYYASHKLGIPSCVAITGSHNPPDYNGFKMVVNGTTLSAEAIQDLKRRIIDGDLVNGNGNYRSASVIDDYIEEISQDIQLDRSLKVVIDCGNGVAGATAPRLYSSLGVDLIELFTEVDGNFPNHHPDPSQAENLVELIDTVKNEQADFGLAFDGDGDRLGVVSADGKVIWPDRQLILFARDVLQRQPGAEIIYDVKCSRSVPAEIEKAGGKATMWRTGHSFIKSKLKQTGAALAGEMSGHIFFKERWYGFDDGVYAGARLIELLAASKESAQAVFAALPDSINTPELRISFKEGEHYQFMHKLQENAQFEQGTVSTMDGIRVDYDDGFGLIRPSNTTPILVLRFEGDTEEALNRIQNDFRHAIHAEDPNLEVPF